MAPRSRLSATRLADPHWERERQRYEQPLPSREYILQKLGEFGAPMTFDALCEVFDIKVHEHEAMLARLSAMSRDGQLLRNRGDAWLIPTRADLISGLVEGHPDGFGFLKPDMRGEADRTDIFLSPKEMAKVLHGDRAIVRVVGVDRKGRPEGKIVEVTERANRNVVARVFEEHGVWFAVAENRRISQDILLAPTAKKSPGKSSLRSGQVVMIELLEQPTKHAQPIGRVVEVLGNYADPGMEIEIALRKHELPFEFNKAAIAQAAGIPETVAPSDWDGREDLRALPFVTIDGETAKDFDDAVYCERRGKGFRLLVAIADVSHYVADGSPLDRNAFDRGNSVYFPRRVIPMLPEKLSNGLCSLNPRLPRLCMVADMEVTGTGQVRRYRFYPAVIFSHARLTYEQVAGALYERNETTRSQLGDLVAHLETLDGVFRVLLASRGQRGAMDFDTLETRMVFDDHGKISAIEPTERNDAHRLIEECMLAANVCASDLLSSERHPVLYRVHEGPTTQRLVRLREFLGTFGLQLAGGDSPTAKDYSKVIERIGDRPERQLLQTVMLRSLRQAIYSPDNVGHFGLAYESYTHFTSPIRRYPDLLVHRAIKACLNKSKYNPAALDGDWAQIGLHCSMTERRADDATRDVEAWLKCYFMQDRIGETFSGCISSVVPFGIFVALDDVFVEGLVHVSDLGADYFHFDEVHHAMIGERSGRKFRLSDRVKVQLVRVDLEANKIDFRLSDASPQKSSQRVRKP